jgi:hypothetical protein
VYCGVTDLAGNRERRVIRKRVAGAVSDRRAGQQSAARKRSGSCRLQSARAGCPNMAEQSLASADSFIGAMSAPSRSAAGGLLTPDMLCQSPNKQLRRTVTHKVPRHRRQRAAAELRR